MNVNRQLEFSRLQGLLMRFGIPTTDPAFQTLKEMEENVGNMTALQLSQIETLIEQVVDARNGIVKEKIVDAVRKHEL